MDAPGTGPRVAIKDLIDVAGTPTTAACAVLARQAEPAERDAACLAGLRAADVAIVGKANLHELACGGTGINPHFGTPVNPFDPACIPGGSSSGSAVRAGRRRGRHRARQRHGRLDPQPVGVLWHGRPQDHVGPHPARGRVAAGAVARHGRPDGARRGRRHRRDGAAGAGLRGRRRPVTGDRPRAPARHRSARSTRPSTRRWPPASSRSWRSISPGGTRPARPASR